MKAARELSAAGTGMGGNKPKRRYLVASGREAVLSMAPGTSPVMWLTVSGFQTVEVAGRNVLLVLGSHMGASMLSPLTVLAVAPDVDLDAGPVAVALTPAGRLALVRP